MPPETTEQPAKKPYPPPTPEQIAAGDAQKAAELDLQLQAIAGKHQFWKERDAAVREEVREKAHLHANKPKPPPPMTDDERQKLEVKQREDAAEAAAVARSKWEGENAERVAKKLKTPDPAKLAWEKSNAERVAKKTAEIEAEAARAKELAERERVDAEHAAAMASIEAEPEEEAPATPRAPVKPKKKS